MHQEPIVPMLRPVFGRNWRFWLCVVPVATLSLPAARLWHSFLRSGNRLTRIAQAALRHLVCRGQLLQPHTSSRPAELPAEIVSAP